MTSDLDVIRAGTPAKTNEAPNKLLDDVRQSTGGAPEDRFKKMPEAELEGIIAQERDGSPEQLGLKKSAYEELIKRHDARFTSAHHQEVLPKMALLMECIKQGKGLKPCADGGYEIAPEKQLSEEDRYAYHNAIVQTIGLMHNPIALRQNYVTFLRSEKQFADAVKVAQSEADKAQLLMNPIANGSKGSIKMMDLILEEQGRLLTDVGLISDPVKRQKMINTQAQLRGKNADEGIVNAPVNAFKQLAFLYLGTDIVLQRDKQGNPIAVEGAKFGVNTGFKPELAMMAAIRARDTLAYVSKNDPSAPAFAEVNPAEVSLFGNDYDKIPNGEKFNMFLDENRNGKPDLLEGASIENLNNKIKENSTSASTFLDVGVAIVGMAAAAAIHNPCATRVVDSLLGKVGLAERAAANPALAARLTKGAAVATAVGVTIPTRHYGYSILTGGQESWTDSTVHAAGTMLAAEVGSRVGGRATPLMENAGGVISKPFQFAKFDAKASAELFAKEGYQTTGRVSEMLKAGGYEKEASILRKLAPDTPISSPLGRQAVEHAELTYGRMSTASQAIIKDQRAVAKAAKTAAAETAKMAPAAEPKLAANVPTSVDAMQIKGESAISRMKHQVSDRFRTTAIEPSTATAQQMVRARTGSALYSSFATTATYNTVVTTNDLQHKVNGETMQKFTFLEALKEAHLPSFKGEEQVPWAARYAVKALLGTPGQALFAAPFMPPSTMGKAVWSKTPELWSSAAHGAPYKAFKTALWLPGQIMHTLPVTKLGVNNLNTKFFTNPVLGPVAALAGNRAYPALESLGSGFSIENGQTVDLNEHYKKMLENAQKPVRNGA